MSDTIHTVKAGTKTDSAYREFVIGSASDVANLPTPTPNADGETAGPGSIAYTEDLTHFYLLGPDGVWREV